MPRKGAKKVSPYQRRKEHEARMNDALENKASSARSSNAQANLAASQARKAKRRK